MKKMNANYTPMRALLGLTCPQKAEYMNKYEINNKNLLHRKNV